MFCSTKSPAQILPGTFLIADHIAHCTVFPFDNNSVLAYWKFLEHDVQTRIITVAKSKGPPVHIFFFNSTLFSLVKLN